MSRTDMTPRSKSARTPESSRHRLGSLMHHPSWFVRTCQGHHQGDIGNLGRQRHDHDDLCWIAEALYGVTDTRTLLLRGWLTAVHTERRRGWRLVACAESLDQRSQFIRPSACRATFLPLFDFLAGKAFDTRIRAAGPA